MGYSAHALDPFLDQQLSEQAENPLDNRAFLSKRPTGTTLASVLPDGGVRCKVERQFHSSAHSHSMSHFFSRHLVTGLAGFLMATQSGFAQTSASPASTSVDVALTITSDRIGRVVISDKQLAEDGILPTQNALDFRRLPPEIRERIQRFEITREAYLKRHEELKQRLRGAATDEERQRIRDQISKALDAWRERAKQSRLELKERIKDLQRERLQELKERNDAARPSRPTDPGRDR